MRISHLLENAQRSALLGIQQEIVERLPDHWESELKTWEGDLFLAVRSKTLRQWVHVSEDYGIHYVTPERYDSIVVCDDIDELIGNLQSIQDTGWCLD